MPKQKQKIRLSKKLQMGVASPSSQETFFKIGGVFFLALSLILIYSTVAGVHNSHQIDQTTGQNQTTDPQVLGAYDDASNHKYTNYTVQKGDTLFNIAQKNNMSWSAIATLNNLQAPYALKPGTVLKLEASK